MPRVGFSGGSTWIEVSLPDGNTVRENIHTETIATRLIELLDANGGLAPAWQVQTEQVRWQHAQEQVQELQAQRDALVTITVSHKKDGSITVQSIHPGQEARYAELDATTQPSPTTVERTAFRVQAGYWQTSSSGRRSLCDTGQRGRECGLQEPTFWGVGGACGR